MGCQKDEVNHKNLTPLCYVKNLRRYSYGIQAKIVFRCAKSEYSFEPLELL